MYSPDPVVASVLDHLRRIVRALRVGAGGPGMSSAQLFVLAALAAEPGASLRRLAARTLTDASSVSVVVARLVADGLVARRRDPADARRAVLSLTRRGAARLARAPEPVQTRLVAALRAQPAARLRAVDAALGAVVTSLGAGGGAAAMFFEEAPRRRSRGDA
jgi:DNA-binding MarR family transcriptional regulator